MDDNNNIEKFFKQKFSENIPQESWNTPDESVWDAVALTLGSKKKNRRILPFLPWLIAGMSTIASVYFWHSNQTYNDRIFLLEKQIERCNLNNELNSNETLNTIDNQGLAEITTARAVKENSEALNAKRKTIPSSIAQSQIDGNSLNSRSTFTHEKNQKIINFGEQNVLPILASRSDESIGIHKESQHLISKKFQELIENRPLDVSPFLPYKNHLFVDPRNFNLNVYQPSLQKDNLKNSRFSVGPSITFYNWIDRSNGQFDNPLSELLISEKTSSSVGYGIQSRYKIKTKFSLELGLQYVKRNQISNYGLSIPYSISTETENNMGNMDNTFSHSLPTGLGNVETDLTLTRNQLTPISDNELINLDFSFQNSTSALMFPISLSYHIDEVEEGLFVSFGLFNEVVVHNRIDKISATSHHTYVKEKDVSIRFDAKQINKYNLGILAGIGYQKKLIGNTNLLLTASYTKMWENIFTSADYTHRIDNIGLNASFIKTL